MAATRADVARAAGVSPSTVTYVLSGQRSTRSSTRERVMRAVRELDYHPNIAARSLASPGLRTAGVLFRRQRSTIDANDLDYVDGVRRALEPSGIQVVIPVMTSSAPLIELRSLVRSGSLGGVVLMDVAQGDEREAMLLDEEIPTVLIGSSGRAVGAPGVDTDFVQMAHASVEHLAGLGHRRIVALMRETAYDDAHARQDQAHELLRAAGDLGVDVLVRQVPELALAGGDIVGADG
ncbi:LacI family DNA-binding transcriptional regulator, partial [Actinomyces naeslundii]|uniref:LacI family DNA-binding transcriptional regulator n=1 Tax=Actinomyces naeslundii TaxID=1655 RepID=UPI0028D367EE